MRFLFPHGLGMIKERPLGRVRGGHYCGRNIYSLLLLLLP